MYIGCPQFVFTQLKTTGWTTDDKTKIVNLPHNSHGRLKMRLFWQRKELFIEEKRGKARVFYLTKLSILRLYGVIHGIRIEREYVEYV